jgi:Ice-binding-like
MRKIGSSRASPRRADYFWLAAGPAIAGALAIALVIAMSLFSQSASAATAAVNLGTAGSYAVLAGSTVTNTGPSVISGNVGVSPGTAVTGFGGAPNGTVNNGTIHTADASAASAQRALTRAYNDAAGRPKSASISAAIGAGQTLGPGVYNATSGLEVGGSLILDGDSSAVFIFQAGSTLTTDTGTTITLAGGAQACNVFWQVGSSATINSGTVFVGTILASTAITVGTGDTIMGRALASTAAVTLDDDTITAPTCTTPGGGGSGSSSPPGGGGSSSAPGGGGSSSSAPGGGGSSSSAPGGGGSSSAPGGGGSSSAPGGTTGPTPKPKPKAKPKPKPKPKPAPIPSPVGTTFPVTG